MRSLSYQMDESSGAKDGFKCCSMCMRHCFETHGGFGRHEAEKLFSAPSFSSLIKTSHMTGSKFLRIPVLFMENQTYNIGKKLRLQGPRGFECECTVQRHSKGYVLHTGFNQFVEHHTIGAGDLLVFNLIAKSRFLVKVYDKCGIEKAFRTKISSMDAELVPLSKMSHNSNPKRRFSSKESRHVEDVEDSDDEGADEGSDEEAVDRMHNLRRKQLSKELEVSSREETKGRSCSNMLEPSFDQHEANMARLNEHALQGDCVDVSLLSKDLAAGNVGDLQELAATRSQYSGQKRKLPVMPDAFRRGENENEREQVIKSFISGVGEKRESTKRLVNAANTLRHELNNPSQLIFMKNSHVNHCRTVYLSKLPLPDHSEVLTLVDEAGASYTVKWIVQDGRSRLASGWEQFVFDHKLAIDDACVFEANEIHLITVYVFRLADYCNPTSEDQQQDQDHRDDLQPSALEQSISEELDCRGEQEEDIASAGLC